MSYLGEALGFLGELGLFDVILPWLLIFVMVFALMERTKVFGTEPDGSSKKNLNALFAFAMGFFAIASARVVNTIHQSIGPVMIVLLCIVLFLLLVSVFEKEGMKEFGTGWKTFFTVVILIALVLIFLGSITNGSGVSWLDYMWSFLTRRRLTDTSGAFGAVILIVIIGLLIFWITGGKSGGKPKED